MREQLAEVAEVEQLPVYRQVDAGAGSPLDANPTVREQLKAGPIEYVTLTSANIARALLRAHEGELVRMRTPAGEEEIEIVRVEYI